MNRLLDALKAHFRRRRSRFATGGVISGPGSNVSDSIPVMLSPGRCVIKRPGETEAEAMRRLMEGVDIDDSPLLRALNDPGSIDVLYRDRWRP
jgi:hypothetical protein